MLTAMSLSSLPSRLAGAAPRTLAVTVAAAIVATLTLAPAVAGANVGKVQEILAKAGNSGVARGPKTVDDSVKAQIEGIARELAGKTGGRAYVVLLPDGSDVDDYAKVYDRLGMGGKDVLIVSSGGRWALRCNGLSKDGKSRLMREVMESTGNPLDRLRKLTAALPAAIAASQGGATRGTAAAAGAGAASSRSAITEPDDGFPYGKTFLVLAVVGGVGFVIWRRRQRDARLDGALTAALDPGERAMAEVFLGIDAVESHPSYDSFLSRASALSTELDELKGKTPTQVEIAKAQELSRRARALESEMRSMTSASAQLGHGA